MLTLKYLSVALFILYVSGKATLGLQRYKGESFQSVLKEGERKKETEKVLEQKLN